VKVEMWPVEMVLQLPVSGDFKWISNRGEWPSHLLDKKLDAQFFIVLQQIEQNGFDRRHPLFVSGDEFVNGHHRLLAALLLGLDEVPVTYDTEASPQTMYDRYGSSRDLADEEFEELEQIKEVLLDSILELVTAA
jgi:hypothetical protein